MRTRAERLVRAGLDRVLVASGYRDDALELARADAIDWARVRVRAARGRRGVVGGSAVVVTAPGRVGLRNIDRVLASVDEVTVEVHTSVISAGTERAQWLRLPNAQPSYPYTPGYSGAGEVIAAGAGAHGLTTGDLVAVAQLPHTSVATVRASYAFRIPEGVRVDDAALLYLAIISGYGVRRAGLHPGDRLCVLGAGPIGALAQRLAMRYEPGAITVIAATRRREEASRRAGADDFRTADDDLRDVGASVVIEATGDPEALVSAVAAAAQGATVVLLGSPRGLTTSAPIAAMREKRLHVVGAHVSALATEARRLGEPPFEALATEFLHALAERRLDVHDLVGDPVDPREIGALYRRLARREVAAAHLDWRRLPATERINARRLLAMPRLTPGRADIHPEGAPRPVRTAARPLRFAAIGCGDIGLANARAIAAAPSAELVLCHDAVLPLGHALSERLGCAHAATIEEAFDTSRVDAVLLSVPHDEHAPLIERAARAGLHIIVEKPLAADLDGGRRAVEAAARCGVALSVCFPYRYDAAVVAAHALARAGALGRMRGAVVVFHSDKPASYWAGGFSGRAPSSWRVERSRAGGGVLIMNLVHYIDLLRHLVGAEPRSVMVRAGFDAGAEVEDAFSATVEFEDGAVGSVFGSTSTRGDLPNRFEMWGDSGTLQLEPEATIYTEQALDGVTAGRWCSLPSGSESEARALFVDRFAAAVLDGRTPDVTAEDGLAVQRFVAAAYTSLAEGRPVELREVSEVRG